MKRSILLFGIFLLVALTGFFSAKAQTCPSTSIVYVDSSVAVGGDGSSWANAYKELKDVLNITQTCGTGITTIYVAKGTYKPAVTTDRDSAFFINRANLKIYGGYPSGGTGTRDIAANKTILSGDIGTAGDNTDNSYHVLVIGGLPGTSDSLVIDGFTITGGYANGFYGYSYGSEYTNESYGGAAYLVDVNNAGATALRNITVTGNYASNYAAGFYLAGCSPSIDNCTFSNQTAGGIGGGLYCDQYANASITNSSFSSNTASSGGGFGLYLSYPSFTNCSFNNNSATNGGGAYIYYNLNTVKINGCSFLSNTATNGGGLYNANASINITNSLFASNIATFGGGAIFNSTCYPVIDNCTIINNAAPGANGYGGAICDQYSSSTSIYNSILWGNTGIYPNVYDNGSFTNISYSDVQGAYPGTGNINSDPLFVDSTNINGADNILGTSDDGLLLRVGSPAIDKGNNGSLLPLNITTDITGAARIQNAIVNMGAYEGTVCPSSSILYVDANVATTTGNGISWASAYKELRNALAVAQQCSGITSIYVAKGTYLPTADNSSDSSFLIPHGGLKIYGGYPSGGGARNIIANPTILSGDIGTANNNTDNSYHVVVIAGLASGADSIVIDGFTITKGNANYGGSKLYNGISIIQNSGGGIALANNSNAGKIAIRNCIITGNSVSNDGGGIYNYYSSPTISNCTFSLNNTTGSGGGIYNYNASPVILSSVFVSDNAANGGGIYNDFSSSPQIYNCLFASNTSSLYGSALYNQNSTSATIINNTFNGNSSGANIGCIYSGSPTTTIINSIVWGNGTAINGTATITYSDIQGGYTGTGNLNTDPFFLNSSDADGTDNIYGTNDDGLIVQTGSPLINKGNNAAVPVSVTTDIANAARIQNTTVDMGAYEGSACPAFTTFYVDNSIATSGNGSSWGNAFKELRDALTAAQQCSSITTIDVAKGTYKPTDDTKRDSAFTILRSNLKIYGGYPTSGGTRNVTANPTILSGDIGAAGNNNDNSYHVVIIAGLTVTDSLVLDGFTITGGNADNSGPGKTYAGTTFLTSEGAGVYLYGNNSAGGSVALRSCTFANNSSAIYGAGVYNRLSSPTIINSIFSANTAANGAGMFNYNISSPVIINCLFTANNATTAGGGMLNQMSSAPAIINSTFYGNTSTGGSAIANSSSSPIVTNSVIWGNTNPPFNNTAATVTYSDVQNGYTGTGNINTDPLFINSTDANGTDNIYGTSDDGLIVQAGSPTIDKGNNTAIAGITTEITGATRIQNAIVDMGAYEGSICPAATTLYVDNSIATPGNGLTWATAFKELRNALNAAQQCSSITTIYVAKGTYKPTDDANRDSAFAITRGGLKIYGGYPNGGGARNITTNTTILSGDIGTVNNTTDNSYHVIVVAGLAAGADSLVIDGFTITTGNANNSGSKTYNGISVTQNNGGGIYVVNDLNTSKTVIRSCYISAGYAANAGGGVFNQNSSPVYSGCTIISNTGVNGAGVYNFSASSPLFTNCIIANNSCTNDAAGMANYQNCSPVLTNCVIVNNTSGRDGGGIASYTTTTPVTLINCTVANNTCIRNGGGLFNQNNPLILTNTIVWGNTSGVYNDVGGTVTATYSNIQGSLLVGTGNLSTDPLFINGSDADGTDNIYGTSDDGLVLQTGSLSINKGNNAVIALTTDITGAARVQNGTVEMGAYEGSACPTFTTLYVDNSVAASGNGSSWATAFKELRDALVTAQCSNITTIYVAQGAYKPTNDANRDSSFIIYRSNLKIYGGYASGGATRNVFTNVTTLSGDIGTANVNTDNSYHVLVIAGITDNTDSLVIDGFTIKGGNANGAGTKTFNSIVTNENEGAGIYLNSDNAAAGKIAMRNCVSINNNATANGGGFYAQLASPTITDCFFAYNNAVYGAGVFAYNGSSSAITNCVITENIATGNGGGIFCQQNSNPEIANCTVQGNTAASGGAVDINNAAPDIVNSIIWDNNPSSNNTLFINYTLFNNTPYFNSSNNSVGLPNDYISNVPLFVNSANPAGADNIFGTADDGLMVRAGSVTIDNGIIDSLPAGITTDILGALRVQGASVDLGAYEGFVCLPSTILYVDSSIVVSGDGSTWATAYKELSNAIRAANECSSITTVNVAKGTYYPTDNTQDVLSSFAILRNNIKIYGGYPTGGGIRNNKSNPTILSGNIVRDNNPYWWVVNNYNSWHVVVIAGITGTDSLVLDGFTITNGNANGGTVNYGSNAINGLYGGGLYIQNNFSVPAGNIAIRNCVITHNSTSQLGGGVYNGQYSSPMFYNCVFAENQGNGAGLCNYLSSSAIITNCVFSGNKAYTSGAAILSDVGSNALITNCTFQGNTNANAIDNGGGGSITKVTNSIIWGNSSGINYGATVNNSDVQGGYLGTGNISTNPLFRDVTNGAGPDNIWGTADDGLIVQAGSDAIDEGINSSVPSSVTTDIAGAARIQNTTVDMGAYEGFYCPSFNTLYVDNNVAASSYGSSWGLAFKELRNALKAVSECNNIDSILVAKGTYYPTTDMTDVDSSFIILRNKIKIYGGYDASTGIRNVAANPTVLSGYLGTYMSNPSNSYHIVVIANITGTDSVVLDGFKITRGGSTVENPYTKLYGGTNVVNGVGGGVCLYNNNAAGSRVALRNCIFSLNQSYDGSAVYNETSSPGIINCVFDNNIGYGKGSGILNSNTSAPVISNCIFTGNYNSTGGIISNEINSNPVIVNSTIYNNSSQAFYNNASSSVIKNSIIWKNNSLTIDPACTVTYSDIQGGYAGTGNINLSPLFVDSVNVAGADNTWATADDGLQLQYGSNAINAGSNAAIAAGITTDILNAVRINNGLVDMGAYERSCPPPTLYVNNSIAVSGDGSSWPNALKEFRQALSAANQCNNVTTINVAAGTYKPTDDNNRDSAFAITRGGLKIYGGYPSGGGTRNILANPTILNGDIATNGDNTDNSYHVMVVAGLNAGADSLVIDGLTITGGNSNGSGSKTYNGLTVWQNSGAGMYILNDLENGKTVIRNCYISSNNSADKGAGVFNQNSSPSFWGCNVLSNTGVNGVGVYNFSYASPSFTNCIIAYNTCTNDAAGMANYQYCSPSLINCVIANNASGRDGGGIASYTTTTPVTLTNCTIANNTCTRNGAGLFNQGNLLTLNNSIIWGNTGGSYPGIYADAASTLNATYCDIQGGYTGTGNINLDPLFISSADVNGIDNIYGTSDDGLMLQPCSPAINEGNNSIIPAAITYDLTNSNRIAYTKTDIGAYEVQFVDLTNSDWKGVNNNWNDIINWCGGYIPSSITNVIIPSGVTYYPLVNNSNGKVRNISIQPAASVTINGSGVLSVANNISNSGTLDISAGTLQMNGGTVAQTLDGSLFANKKIDNLIDSTTSLSVAATSLDTLKIGSSFSFDHISGATFSTGDNITLLSTALKTARVADITNGGNDPGNSISGKAVVERYINSTPQNGWNGRAWRLVTAPIASPQTINASWQENQYNTATSGAGQHNTMPGYGLEITNALSTDPASTGYDKGVTNSPSLLYLNSSTLTWAAPANTNTGSITDHPGYMLFVRGDRGVVITTPPFNTATATTLQVKGTLNQGDVSVTPAVATFGILGNPYASEINLKNIFSTYYSSTLGASYYVWDPKLAGNRNVGAFVSYNYDPIGGTFVSNIPPASPLVNGYIESGQAIFINYIGTSAFTIKETDKSIQSPLVFRPAEQVRHSFQTELFNINDDGTTGLDDGALQLFDAGYDNTVSWVEDTRKVTNSLENLSVYKNGYNIAIEKCKPLNISDTIFYGLSTLSAGIKYRFVFIPTEINDWHLQPLLEDTYLKTKTALSLNDTSNVNFTVTADAASQGNRFRIVFQDTEAGPLPVTFTGIKAWANTDTANTVSWTTTNAINVKEYIIEKSSDGQSFVQVAIVNATSADAYQWIDKNVADAQTYYRIRSIDLNGAVNYTNIVMVKNVIATQEITIYPNPVNGNLVQLKMKNMPAGKYNIRLFNSIGQLITQSISTCDGNGYVAVPLGNKVAAGEYIVSIGTPQGKIINLDANIQSQ